MPVSAAVKASVPALPTAIPLWSPIVGLLVSVGVGVFFWAYPAVEASRIDPIEALRREQRRERVRREGEGAPAA